MLSVSVFWLLITGGSRPSRNKQNYKSPRHAKVMMFWSRNLGVLLGLDQQTVYHNSVSFSFWKFKEQLKNTIKIANFSLQMAATTSKPDIIYLYKPD